MAKGRKLTTSRSERYLGSLSYSQGQGTAADASELDEDDIWAVVDDGDDRAAYGGWDPRASAQSFGGYGSRLPPPPRADNHHVGGLSLAFDDDSGNTASQRIVHQLRPQENAAVSPRHVATSAPVNVPDWSKIYRVESVESLPGWDDGLDEEEPEMVPPHEYLAREYARSRKVAANSVFEGVGRTLKGRDLSRVRDAVWSQTGFYG